MVIIKLSKDYEKSNDSMMNSYICMMHMFYINKN